jgi:hypothetical protein
MEKPRRSTTEGVPKNERDEPTPRPPVLRADEYVEYDPAQSPDEGPANTAGTERETYEDRVERELD